ncbi:MAG: acyl-CoA synthetase FdrA, partial [Gammaproteobacteria bacterium]
MSAVVRNVVKAGLYLDSIVLMQLSVELEAAPGVEEAVLMIGSEPNKRIMADAGLLADAGREAGANDLIIGLRTGSEAEADAALVQAASLLERRGSTGAGASAELRPATIESATAQLADANLALISTPGVFAAREARKAIDRGLNVMIFSDNVPLEDELALKVEAGSRGLLVMGPDCGTAYIAGVPLAFANIIARGGVGVVAASGTGLQEVSVLLTRAGQGLSHGIGVGGRDLSDAIGGLSTLRAIDLQEADDATEHIMLISKPPGVRTAQRVYERLARCNKPVTLCLLGIDANEVPAGLGTVPTLKAAVERVLGGSADDSFDIDGLARQIRQSAGSARHWVHGLYAGGTLCAEAQVVFRAAGLAPASNAPIAGSVSADSGASHRLLDLGSDEYT